MSDNKGSYENRSYLRCLLIDFEKVDCSVTGGWPSVQFQDGGLQTGSSFRLHNYVSAACFLGRFGLPQKCTTLIGRKTGVSDNRGSYENRSHLGHHLVDEW